MIIGSHVSCSGKEMLVGSVLEAVSNNANTFMFYTGAPQNTKRKNINEFNVIEADELLKKYNIDKSNVIVHAPYIINLGNSVNEKTFNLGVEFLNEEIQRVATLGFKYLVLHPGAHVKEGVEKGIEKIIEGLNKITYHKDVFICLETMAGKGSEVGTTFEQLQQIITGVDDSSQLKICLDTCHIHDAGYDLNDFDAILDEFDKIIGVDKLAVLHINDSKNIQGSKKDRHENIGFGYIGFDNLNKIVHHPRLKLIPKILETPYLIKNEESKKTVSPYKVEIEMFKKQEFLKENITDLQR